MMLIGPISILNSKQSRFTNIDEVCQLYWLTYRLDHGHMLGLNIITGDQYMYLVLP
jgi:hypothetical protein